MFVFFLISAFLTCSCADVTFKNVTAVCDIVGGWLPVTIKSSSNLKLNFPKRERILKVSFVDEDLIPILHKNSIKNLKFLVRLDLSNHGVEQIETGAFKNLPRLKILLLERNKLTKIKKGIFNNLKNVTKLSLERNSIRQIAPQAFDGLEDLEVLNVRDNNLRSFSPIWFNGKRNLDLVELQNNFIKRIPEGAFANYTKTIFLDGNRIKNISRIIFGPKNEIFRLSLSGNRIEIWEESFLEGVKIVFFDISYNRVQCLSGNFTNFFVAKLTYLDGNPWNCDSLRKTTEWLSQQQSIIYVQMKSSAENCGIKV